MARLVALVSLLALISAAGATRPGNVVNYKLTDENTCTACLVAMRVMTDLLCDAATGEFVLDMVVHNVCPALGADKDQCTDFAVALVPVAIDWLRASATPAAMCASVGVCGQTTLGNPELDRARYRYRDSSDCPLCKFIVGRTQEALMEGPVDTNDVTRPALQRVSINTLDTGIQAVPIVALPNFACGTLPQELQEACNVMVAKRASIFATFISKMGAAETCAAAGVCNEALMSMRPQPLPAPLVQTVVALHKLQLGAVNGNACDSCKMTVLELHMLLSNPSIQENIRAYSKVLCGNMFPNQADSCNSMIDLYAPLIFQQLDLYVQPDPICQGIHMCVPTTLMEHIQAALLPARRNGLLGSLLGSRAVA